MHKDWDWYKLLGVGAQASSQEIRKAYWDQAKIYHPNKREFDNYSERNALN